MISRQPFQTNEQKQELIAAESERRSYVCFYRELDECIDKCVSWHWHPALEIDYVLEGEIEYQTAEKKYLGTYRRDDFCKFKCHACGGRKRQAARVQSLCTFV